MQGHPILDQSEYTVQWNHVAQFQVTDPRGVTTMAYVPAYAAQQILDLPATAQGDYQGRYQEDGSLKGTAPTFGAPLQILKHIQPHKFKALIETSSEYM